MKHRIYLDYAAATPVDSRVLDAMLPFFTEQFGNPSALYGEAVTAKNALDTARSDVARTLHAKPSEIIFTAGGTDSTNLAVHGVMQRFPDKKVVVSAIEHEAVLVPASQYQCEVVGVSRSGIVDIQKITALLTDDDVVLVSVMLVNNEIGTIQPVEQLARHIANVRVDRRKRGIETPLYLHTDACQAPLYLDCSVDKLSVDMMTLNGGKIYGPKQSGILYVRAGMQLTPVIAGGGQEFGLRSGTENVAFAIGFAKALELSVRGRHERVIATQLVRDSFMKRIEDELAGIITGHRTHRVANNIHVSFPGHDNERMLFSLDMHGIAAASGSACSASKDKPSHVLEAIGMSHDDARSSLRFTIGRDTSEEVIDTVIDALKIALEA